MSGPLKTKHSCTGSRGKKARYATPGVAKVEADRLRQLNGGLFQVYDCWECGGWHVGSLPPRVLWHGGMKGWAPEYRLDWWELDPIRPDERTFGRVTPQMSLENRGARRGRRNAIWRRFLAADKRRVRAAA